MFDKYQYWCTRATFCDQQQDRSDIDFKGSTNEYSKIFKKYLEKLRNISICLTQISILVYTGHVLWPAGQIRYWLKLLAAAAGHLILLPNIDKLTQVGPGHKTIWIKMEGIFQKVEDMLKKVPCLKSLQTAVSGYVVINYINALITHFWNYKKSTEQDFMKNCKTRRRITKNVW